MTPIQDHRRQTNPIFGDNRLKLGLFGHNTSNSQMSSAAEHYVAGWPNSLRLAQAADRMGMEAILSVSVWRGAVYDQPDHLSHNELEPFSWVAALASVTNHSALVATFHAPLVQPAFVAKASATLDQISGGRAAINLVAGSSALGFGQFGKVIDDAVTRYDRSAEFMEVLRRFWTADAEFDFDGRFYQVKRGFFRPKPIQSPWPAVINAGVSERGRAFATRYADVAFTHLKTDPGDWAEPLAAYKTDALERYGKHIQCWTHGYVVVRDSEAEARDYLRYYADEKADQPWLDAWQRELGENATTLRPEQQLHMSRNWAAGGGVELVGTPDSVVAKLTALSEAGLDGILLSALEPEPMLAGWERDVMPRLESAGLRQPHRAG